MAAASTLIAAGTLAFSAGKSIYDMKQGQKIASQAQEAIDNYERQNLENVYAGLSVPTQAYEMQLSQARSTQAQLADTISRMGPRASQAVGSLSDSMANTVQQITSGLAEAEFKLKQLIAEDEARIRGIEENRENMDLRGLGAQYAYGQSLRQSGLTGLTSTLASGANLAASGFFNNQAVPEDTSDILGMTRKNVVPNTGVNINPIPSYDGSANMIPTPNNVGNLKLNLPSIEDPFVAPGGRWQDNIGLNY